MRRNLSGVFFMGIEPETGERGPVCFEELTQAERNRVTKDMTIDCLKSLANILADRLVELGDTYDIVNGEQDEHNQ